ncbi:MAG: hypothetical protein IPI66_14455 [Chitinophagaceae bacterium]|nr:hypothetical protein [Chitinophagaceae bacterium]
MKTELLGGTQNSKKDLKESFKETKETLAAEFTTENNPRSFGLVDLWNEKKQRTSSSLSRWLN